MYHIRFKQAVWVKILHKSEENLKIFQNEILALKNLSHPNIIYMKEFFQDEYAYYIVYNKFKSTTLFNFIKKRMKSFSDTQFQLLVKQLVNTLRYVHFKKFVHGNLSPENIFYDG